MGVQSSGRVSFAVVIAAMAVVAGLAGSPAASGSPVTPVPKPVTRSPAGPGGQPPAGFRSWPQLYRVQGLLDSAATRILAAGGAGNASIVVAAPSRELRVYWHGAVPAAVRALADRLEHEMSVRLRFLPAAYPFRALVVAGRRLAARPPVLRAAPLPDGSGVRVIVPAGARLPVLRRALAPVAGGMPLTISTGQRLRPAFSRQADIPPFWGGSRYVTSAGVSCTNGFSLSTGLGPDIDITAGHCGDSGQTVDIPGLASPTGTMSAKATCRDTILITYNPNFPDSVAGRIYTGPFDSSASAAVADPGPDFVGDLVEDGGASSGENVNIEVVAADMFASGVSDTCAETGPLTEAAYSLPACATAPGDSGGPVYVYHADGTVQARGTIVGGVFVTALCPGEELLGSSIVFYAPMVRPGGDPEIGSLQFYRLFLVPN